MSAPLYVWACGSAWVTDEKADETRAQSLMSLRDTWEHIRWAPRARYRVFCAEEANGRRVALCDNSALFMEQMLRGLTEVTGVLSLLIETGNDQ